MLGREKLISKENIQKYKKGLCTNAESIQPNIFQFKTNYWDINKAYQQAEILRNTLNYFKNLKNIL